MDHNILNTVAAWIAEGRKVALATVIETWGSAPQTVGSQLVVDSDGNFMGAVSGGCVEGDVITQAIDAISSGNHVTLLFGVADETAWRVGLACGGKIRIYVEPVA
jgi:xanthine/CO dehydrogenase XdhC/CoxF family maturation factor